MALNEFISRLSVLDLVASDYAYNSTNVIAGQTLKSFRDSQPGDEEAFPRGLLSSLPTSQQDLSSIYHSIYRTGAQYGSGVVEFDDWVVAKTFDIKANGFGAIVFKTAQSLNGKSEYIVALRGSDGKDARDWFANLDLAKEVWRDVGPSVISYLASLDDVADLNFTGQSLGGGLAQYAAYDYASQLRAEGRFNADEMSLITFNGFGGVRGLQQLHPTDFRYDLLKDVVTAHYSIDNDLVHRLGAGKSADLEAVGGSWHLNGNVNGQINTYQFPFVQYQDGVPVSFSNGRIKKLYFVDAHRIESGFYRGFANTGLGFLRGPTPKAISYLDTDASQSLGAAWSRVFNKGLTTETSAAARIYIGLTAIGIAGNRTEIRRLSRALLDSYYASNEVSVLTALQLEYLAFPEVIWLASAATASLTLPAQLLASSLELLSDLSADEKKSVWDGVNSFLPRNKRLTQNDLLLSQDVGSQDRATMYLFGLVGLASRMTPSDRDAFLRDPNQRATATILSKTAIDGDQMLQALTSGERWITTSLDYVGQSIVSASGLTTAEKQYAIQLAVLELARDAKRVAANDQSFLDRVRTELSSFLKDDLVGAIAKANGDVVGTFNASILIGANLAFRELREITDALVANLRSIGEKALELLTGSSSAQASEIDRQVREIRNAVQGAAQSIVMRERAGITPSNVDAFDPNSTSIATGTIPENGSRFFTLYLPYSAATGGQKVLLTAVGDKVDKLRLNTGEETPNVSGTFTVTVPEGTRQLVLAFGELGDIDEDSTIEIKAQLIDASGNPTHNEHLELTLTLDGEAEAEIAEAPGTTSVTVLGDQRYQEFTDVAEATGGSAGTGFIPDVPRGPNEQHVWTSPGFVPPADWVNLEITDATYQVEGSDFDPDTGITTTYYAVTGYTVLHNRLDELGNVITDATPEPDQPESLFGSAGADLIDARGGDDNVEAKAGDDTVYAGSGNDDVEAGAGNDWVDGGSELDFINGDAGNDRLIGGAGVDLLSGDVSRAYILNRGFTPDASTALEGEDVLEGGLGGMDMLLGGGGKDQLFAKAVQDRDVAISEGEASGASGERGDWLAGGGGDDLVVGAQDNEALFGGSGSDLLIAGAGDDHINADQSYVNEYYDWNITETITTLGIETVYTYHYGFVFSDGDAEGEGADRIYAGAGNDVVLAGGGEDFVDAGSGADKVWGEAGGDIIIGGAGDDILNGDNSTSQLAASQHGDDFLDGGEGNDRLLGDGGNDALYGGAGDDFLQGDTLNVVGGADYLNGESGNDTLSGNGGMDVLVGGTGDDELFGDSDDTALADQAADELYGGEGNDRLQGYAGIDYLDGGSGQDELFGGADADTLLGGDGNDRLFGEDGTGVGDGGDDTIVGGLGDDEIRGEGGSDTIDGGGGADVIGGDAGNDTIFGGLGVDQLVGGEGNDILRGDGGNDVILGEAGADDIEGGTGDDNIEGGDDADRIAGGEGDDTLQGGSGSDVLFGNENRDLLFGGAGEDILDGGAGNDHMQGGAGFDTYVWDFGCDVDTVFDVGNNAVRFGAGISGDFLSLGIGSLLIRVAGESALHIEGFDAQNPYADIGISELQFTDFDGNVVDTMSWNELVDLGFDLVGTPDADVILGTAAADRIYGLEEQDVLFGRGGDDTIYGGQGGDSIFAEDGNDTLFGEDGDDSINGGAGHDTVFGDTGNDVLNLGEGDDVAEGGEGDDSIYGEAGDDRLAGGIGNDDLGGGDGADSLDGGIGDDALYGDAGDDVLTGGEGNDFHQGGDGVDVLAGGFGDDTYFLDDSLDLYTENAGEGDDTIIATFDYALGEHFENLELAAGSAAISGTGSAIDNHLQGNENDNLLFGLEGDDALFGSDGNDALDGGTGNDFMFGGFGEDTFLVDSEDDVVEEQYDLYHREYLFDDFGNALSYGFLEASGGYDTVQASVSFALDQWTEALILTGSDAIDGTGNVEWNYLQGSDADNTLYAYRLNGEADTYPSIGIIVQQFTNPRNAAEEMLQDKANVAIYRAEFPWFVPQQVDLYAGAGDDVYGMEGDDRLYGGLDNDYLFGGDGDDLLYGFAGSDTMAGGAGDDTYVVSGAYSFRFNYVGGEYVSYEDEGTDDLYEAENEGADTVYSEVDFALPEDFENLTLVFDSRDFDPDAQASKLRFGYVSATVGEGNELNNVITANDGGNWLYGQEGDDSLVGGAGNDYLAGDEGADTMRGAAGDDAYDVDDAGDLVIENEGGGHDVVYSAIDYTLTAHVEDLYLGGETYTENLSGTGNELDNLIVGNDGDNVLAGLAGNDMLDGGAGNDVMDGGAGDDTYHVDSELDVTTELADPGHDTVYSSVSHVLGDNIENLYLTGFDDISGDGNALDNLIFGNGGSNDLQGYEGNDVIEGNGGGDGLYGDEGNDVLRGGDSDDYLGGGAGDDLLDGGADGDEMAGGAGNDTYYIDSENDTVFEVTGEGVDKVFERIWYYQMGGSIENATMLGDFQDINDFDARTIEGNALDNIITGNDGANWLAGYGGADTIDGRARDDEIYGGEGGDLIYGGDDAIRYEPQYIDSYGDLYSWNGGDFKLSTVNRSELASNSDFLDGGAGDDSIDAGSGDDRLYGEEGDDFLYGGDDGLVADSAEFGGGNEEEGGGGTDETDDGRVFLTNNDYLSGGAGKDVLDGGSGNDDLYGGAGDDTLYGGTDGPLNRNGRDYLDGGAGIDTMAGGTYDDTYVVDGFFYLTTDIEVYDDCGELVPGAVTRVWTTDTVFENSDEGYDRVYSYADYTLPENVEQLDLAWGSDARIGRGNAGDNRIIGNDFDNRLEGGAGNDELYGSYGNDVLDGGAGDDTLVGEAGANVYNFGARYGHDTVYSYGGGFDSVHLLQDIAASELTLTRQGNDVVIGLAGSGDRMVLANWFGRTDRVRQIVFCDDPAWDEATIAALANGRIDPVSAHDDIALVVEDAALVSTGNVLDNDVTTDAPLAVGNAGTYAGAYGTLELSADGSFTYTLDNDAAQVQAVAQGENFQEYFGYEAVGGFGAYADAALVVEVAGANDAPVFGPGTTGTVVEDAGGLVRYADGNVLFNGGFYFGLYEWELDGNAAYAGWDLLAWEGPTAAYFGAIGSPALLSQDVEVFEGGRYLLEFDLLGGAPDGAEFSVSWNGATLLSLNNTGLENEYRHYQVALDGVEGISRLEFSLRNDPGYWHLDDVRLGLLVEFENPPEFQQTSGALGFSDVDYSDWHVLSVQPRDENPLGSFDATITSDSAYGEAGSVVWNFSVANGDLQFLAEGETREQVYDLTLEDGYGGTATQSVTVTLRGVNDLPEAENDWIALQEDGVVAVSGNALDNDFDLDLADELSVVERGSFAGLYGTLDLAADGSFTYTLHNDSNTVQALNAGELVEDVFEYAVTDGLAFNLPQLFVEIEGVNDAPVAQDDAATVEEDAVLFAQGNVLANDSDADAGSLIVVSTPGVYAGAFGSLTLGADGSYVYALDHAAAQPLARGQEMQEVFAYDVTDGLETATAALTVSVNGANDAPTTEDLLAIVSEDGPGVTLTPVYGDADAGSVQLLAVGAFSNAGFELGGFVGWQLSDAALGEVLSGGAPLGAYYASLRSGAGQDAYTVLSRNFTLAAGESISGFAEFITGDALPFDDNGYVSVRLLGGASTPLIGASVATVGDYGSSGWMPFEFAAPETGTYVLEAGVRNTQDNSIDSRLLLDGMEHFGPAVGVTINADGTFDYDPGGRFEWLAEGEFATDSFSYTVTDNHGAQAVATAMVQVVGANDAPEIGAAQTAAGVTEENTLPAATVLGAQGAIAFSDVDLSDVHEVQVGTLDSGYLGEFAAQLSVDSTGGVGGSVRWSFSIENGALDAMGEGEFLEQSYEVLVDDGHGGIAQRIVTVTLNGANDAPVALIDAVGVQEDGTLGATGNVLGNDSDVDTNDVLSVANPGTYTRSYGTLTLLADGSYSYALDNDTAQSLAQGQEVQEVFGYATTDGIASTAANLTVTISGANDAPVTEDDAANVKEDGVTTASGNVLANDSDVDSGTTLTVANAGRYGSLDLSGDGNYTYTLDNSSAAVQGLRAGEVVTDSFAYLASDGWESTPGTLTVSVAGSNDDPLAHADAGAAQEDAGPVTLPGSALLANDTDADFDDTKSLLAVTNSAAGAQVTLVGGSVIYNVGGLYQTLKAGATAADSFSYTMVDAAGAASTATVAMTITGVNDAPMLVTPIADQNAAAGTAFNFAFAPNTFNDIDMGDTLAYSASLADGTALPSWLAFDAALRTFSGTPPGGTGGGTGEDCGCGTVVGGAPETLQLRVTATDTTGASANDVFVLNIAGGSSGGGIVPVVGTNHDDAIAGTSGNDVIDGRKGYDKMSGGAGDDAYFVDRNGSRVDLVIEGAVAGYDTVYSEADYTLPSNVEELHLIGNEELEGRGNALANMLIGNSGDNRLYGMAGNDLLLDDAGEDQLDGGDGDDVLDGGAGNDALTGGKGNDLFVHAKGGGHDLVQDSGGQDAIRFGYGIAAGDVTVRRVEGDLVLRLSVDGGSVTVKDWFSSSSKRIEQVQFADGTVWNESAIRARVTSGSDGEQGGHAAYYDDGQSGCGSGERSNGHEDDHDDDHHGGHDDNEERSGLFDAIAARLKRSADYDFTALAVYLQRQGGGGYGAMTPEQIAQRWVQVQNCVGSLARAEGDCGDGYGGKGHYGGYGCDDDRSHGGWGYSGSTGQSSGCGGMGTFSGLGEGFQKL